MPEADKPVEETAKFEFEALSAAANYRQALLSEFSPFLEGDVIEVGAGIGQFSDVLLNFPRIRKLISIEPDPAFCQRYRDRLPGVTLVQGTVANLPPETAADGIVSVNVLEHIEQDRQELNAYSRLLKVRGGALCLFVPARQEIYAPLDKDFGHFRRYSKNELREKLAFAGFEIVRLNYFNFFGYFAWWLIFRVMRKRAFKPAGVRRFDKLIFPVVHFLESKILRPPFGQSLLAVARPK
jgi:SAM-dependent methyltransferase